LLKATVNFIMSLCLSVHPFVYLSVHTEQPYFYWMDLH